MSTVTPDVLEWRRARMIEKLADWHEEIDPCADGHVEHGPEGHIGRHLVHSVSEHGFGAVWDYDAVVAYIQTATEIGVSIEAERTRESHIPVRGTGDPDRRIMFFEVRP